MYPFTRGLVTHPFPRALPFSRFSREGGAVFICAAKVSQPCRASNPLQPSVQNRQSSIAVSSPDSHSEPPNASNNAYITRSAPANP